MLSKKFFLAISVSFGLAVAAAVLANNWINKQTHAKKAPSIDTKQIVVAAVQIPYGDTIEAHHVKLKEMPIAYLPEGYLTDVKKVEGTVSKRELIEGEVLLPHHFIEPNSGNLLAALLDENMRAVTVRVNDVVGVAGFLMPGNYVDVVSARRLQNNQYTTSTVLQKIKVLAVDQKANADESNSPTLVRSVTLSVSPKQAELLVKARSEGEIQLTLRNPNEDLPVKVLADNPKPKPVKRTTRPTPKRSYSQDITIIRGVDSEKKRVSL